MRILIVSFSARQDGNCDGISRMIQEHYDHSCTVFRFSQQQIHPCADAATSALERKRRAHISQIRNMGCWTLSVTTI